MKKYLEKRLSQDEENSGKVLRHIVARIRPRWFRSAGHANKRLAEFIEALKQDDSMRQTLQEHLDKVMQSHPLALYTEAGILSNEGFFAELMRKVGHVLLPPAPAHDELRDNFNYIFFKRRDYQWVSKLDDALLSDLLQVLFPPELLEERESEFLSSIGDSMEILSHRLASVGLDPAIISRYPDLRSTENPVIQLNRKITQLFSDIRSRGAAGIRPEGLKNIRENIDECVHLVREIRSGQHETGASLSLTYLLHRMRQHLNRMLMFVEMLETHGERSHWKPQVQFFKQLVRFENERYSLRELITKNGGFLAYQITEHGGKTGEHYITHGRKDYVKMMWSAMGGGLIVGFLSCFKVGIYYLRLAPFGEAFWYSMNYSFGFIGIHLTHSTLATKQPAMTASRIAAVMDDKTSIQKSIESLSELVVKVLRSQFVAFMGNIFIAFPVAFLVALLYAQVFGSPIAGSEKAHHLIHELHPFETLSLFHAGIAGVCLFLAGVISGYYDNAVVYRKLPRRLYHHPLLRRLMPKSVRQQFSNYIGNNLGSLMGNFTLGIMLGSMGTLGFLFGLPIDIRHITFSSGNFGLAMASVGSELDAATIGISVLGILLIGFMNFAVSFSLALAVAIQSRRVSFTHTGLLLRNLLVLFFTRPKEFFFPPTEVEIPETTEVKESWVGDEELSEEEK